MGHTIRVILLSGLLASPPSGSSIGLSRDEVENLRKNAEAGDLEAQGALAYHFWDKAHRWGEFNGDPVIHDCFLWAERAALQGHTHAALMLGRLYREGKGCARNAEAALDWFNLAARQGSSSAFLFLAEIYLNGEGTEPDLIQACAWYSLCQANSCIHPPDLAGQCDQVLGNLSACLSVEDNVAVDEMVKRLKDEIRAGRNSRRSSLRMSGAWAQTSMRLSARTELRQKPIDLR